MLLNTLDLSECTFPSIDGSAALGHAVAALETLQVLEVRRCGLDERNIGELAQALAKLRFLRAVDLRCNSIDIMISAQRTWLMRWKDLQHAPP